MPRPEDFTNEDIWLLHERLVANGRGDAPFAVRIVVEHHIANPSLCINDKFKRMFDDSYLLYRIHALAPKDIYPVLYDAPLEELPTRIGHVNLIIRSIAEWRLEIGK